MENKLIVSVSPHLKGRESVSRIMWSVVLALLPAGVAGVYLFGIHALQVILVSVVTALLTEALAQRLIFKKSISINDGSAVITGLLLAYCLPPGIPLWMAAVGSAVAIFLGKLVFGGLGYNIFNPALIGRAFLLASWPVYMTTWIKPFTYPDAVTGATPLGIIQEGIMRGKELSVITQQLPGYWDMAIGACAGSIGETSAILLLLGAVFLFIRRIISWHTPIVYIGTVTVLSLLFGQDPLFQILAGGLFLGAFFMATDMVTTPLTPWGRVIFGLGAGILVVLIRNLGGYPEGVCYSILIMNAFTPLIDRLTRPRKFGGDRSLVWGDR